MNTTVTLDDIIITKTGDSNQGEDCELYGVNAGLLVKDGAVVDITNGHISSSALGANALFAIGGEKFGQDGSRIDISDSDILTTGDRSNGVTVIDGGLLNVTDTTINTSGEFSSAINAQQTGGGITVQRGTYVSNGLDAPVIMCNALIKVKEANFISNVSEGACISNRNSLEMRDCNMTIYNATPKLKSLLRCSIMIYDPLAEESLSGVNELLIKGGTINSLIGHVIHVTNTTAKVTLDGVTINNSDFDNILFSLINNAWGGFDNRAELHLKNMHVGGEILVDNTPEPLSREDSFLDLTLSDSTIFTGTINNKVRYSTMVGDVNLKIEKGSRFILTGNSYVKTIENEGRVISGDFKLYVNGEEYDDGGGMYPTESILILDGRNYEIDDEPGKITMSRDATTGVMMASITDSGQFTIRGLGVNTVIRVCQNVKDVELILAGLTLDNVDYASMHGIDRPAFIFESGSETTVTLTGASSIKGSKKFIESPEPIIRGFRSKIKFQGAGSLDVIDSFSKTTDFGNNIPPAGISNTEGILEFESGTISIKATGDGVRAEKGQVSLKGSSIDIKYAGLDGVNVRDGFLNISSGSLNLNETVNDGINAEVVSDESAGYVVISGGSISSLNVYRNGIKCEHFNMSDGSVSIRTIFKKSARDYYVPGNNVISRNTIFTTEYREITRINVYTGYHSGLKIGRRGRTYSYLYVPPTDPHHQAGKVYVDTASGSFTMTGGTLSIDTTRTGLMARHMASGEYSSCSSGVYMIGSPGHAIECFNTATITGGKVIISSAGDAIFCDGIVSITNQSVIDIKECYEGLRSSNIAIGTQNVTKGPNISIYCNGDGIVTDYNLYNYTYDDSRDEDVNYTIVADDRAVYGNNVVIYECDLTINIDSVVIKEVELQNVTTEGYVKQDVKYMARGSGFNLLGMLDVHKGNIIVYGQSTEGYIPVVTTAGFKCNHLADVLLTGVDPNNLSVPKSGDCIYIKPQDKSYVKGSIFKVKTTGGEYAYDGKLINAGNYIIVCSPLLVFNNKYEVTIGESKYLIKAYKPENSNDGT